MTGKDIQILRDLRSTCSDENIKNAINEALFAFAGLEAIWKSGRCADCRHKEICKFRPNLDLGEQERYNCPFFIREGEQ